MIRELQNRGDFVDMWSTPRTSHSGKIEVAALRPQFFETDSIRKGPRVLTNCAASEQPRGISLRRTTPRRAAVYLLRLRSRPLVNDKGGPRRTPTPLTKVARDRTNALPVRNGNEAKRKKNEETKYEKPTVREGPEGRSRLTSFLDVDRPFVLLFSGEPLMQPSSGSFTSAGCSICSKSSRFSVSPDVSSLTRRPQI